MKRIKLLLTLALLMTAATSAWADWDGETYTATATEEIKGDITVMDNATLTINEGATVTVNGTINVNEGMTLTIYGPGTLNVNGPDGDNGSGSPAFNGTVVINSGTVTANGGNGNGSGSSSAKGATAFTGTVTIIRGDVTATAGNSCEGQNGSPAFGGSVTIYGGSVIATGGKNGGGLFVPQYAGNAFDGNVTFYGGKVTATGGDGVNGFESTGVAGNAFASEPIFEVTSYTMTDGTNEITSVDGEKKVVIEAPDYVDKIALTPDETGKEWTLAAMPAYNVQLVATYYPQATIATAPAASTETIYMGTTTALITAGSSEEGTLMYLVSTTEPTSTDGFSADLPTAQDITEAGNSKVYYYVKGDDTHSDSDIAAEPLLVTVLSDKYDITFAAANAYTIEAGKATVTVGGTAATVSDGKLTGAKMGSEVKIKAKTGYKIKSMEAEEKAIDLSKVKADVTLQDGDVVKGKLSANVKITIADGATVTLKGATINGVSNDNYLWAGLTCEGDATIILADGSENTMKGFNSTYPGIFVPVDKTLTIKGAGKLTASSNGQGAGIGGGFENSCGSIAIEGGIITANAGNDCAGIGSGNGASCGAITISGGKVTAYGGDMSAGIGSGSSDGSSCGTITITGGEVTGTAGQNGAGIGSGYYSSCGDIIISGGTVTAMGGFRAASIGSGYNGSCTSVTITTGVTSVTATKGAQSSYCINASKVKIGNGDETTDMSAIYDNGESTFTFPVN